MFLPTREQEALRDCAWFETRPVGSLLTMTNNYGAQNIRRPEEAAMRPSGRTQSVQSAVITGTGPSSGGRGPTRISAPSRESAAFQSMRTSRNTIFHAPSMRR